MLRAPCLRDTEPRCALFITNSAVRGELVIDIGPAALCIHYSVIGRLATKRGDCGAGALIHGLWELCHRVETRRVNARASWLRDGLSLCNVMVDLSLVNLNLLLPVVTLGAFGTVGLSRLVFDLTRLASLAFRGQVVQLRVIRGQAPVRRC